MLPVIGRLSFDWLAELGDDGINEFLEVEAVVVFVALEDVLKGAFCEFGIDVDALEIFHVLFFEVLSGLVLGEEIVGIFVEFLEC